MNDFCSRKGVKREFSNARTPQQNGVVERRNRTLIEAARTMLANAKLNVTFWLKQLTLPDAASQDVKKDVSSLRYIALLNWLHDAHLESSTKSLGDQIETLAVETTIPTVSSPLHTACLDDSPEPLSDTRLISKRVTSQDDTPSLDNILTLSNRFEDILRVTTNTDHLQKQLDKAEFQEDGSMTAFWRVNNQFQKFIDSQ
nr:putative ribonuclease H-like domain-containing protein [Tanacetum cinerariifolium]